MNGFELQKLGLVCGLGVSVGVEEGFSWRKEDGFCWEWSLVGKGWN